MILVEKGEFLDTNVLFDAVYTARPLYQKFHTRFGSIYLLKQLSITVSVGTEAQRIATESINFLVNRLYNMIKPLEWDELSASEKSNAIKTLNKEIDADQEIKDANRTIFVQDVLKLIALQLQNLTKKEIIEQLCPNLHYTYTRDLQGKIFEHFNMPPVDRSHPNHKNFLDVIKRANKTCKAFEMKDNQDFDILTDITLLISVGAKYDNNFTQDFNSINFYSRDTRFENNFKEFKKHFDSNTNRNSNEDSIKEAIDNINMNKPY